MTGCESHCHGCGQDVRTLCLCTTAIVISIVLVLAGSESHCKCCEKDVCEVCLCTGAIVICRTSVCAACESPCKCCIEVEYPSPSPSPSCPSHLRPSHHEPSYHTHTYLISICVSYTSFPPALFFPFHPAAGGPALSAVAGAVSRGCGEGGYEARLRATSTRIYVASVITAFS